MRAVTRHAGEELAGPFSHVRARLLPRRRGARAVRPAHSAADLLQHCEVVEQLVLDLDELAEALLVRAEPLSQRIDVEPRLKGQRR